MTNAARGNTPTRERPGWLDPGLAAAFTFACVSAWPLLSRASLPQLTDAHHHAFRAFEILAAWHQRILYTRWAADFYYGYGYPVFNFYAPFTHYLAAAYGIFFGPVAGVKFGLVLATFLGTLGVYLFGRQQWGPLAGAVSAAVYAAAPYIALIDPVIRGALPEAMAIGLGPIVLWSFTALARTRSRGFFAVAVISLAMLITSHNLMSFVLLGFTGAWVLWDTALIHKPANRAGWLAALAWPAAAGLLAVGLTAFVWLPAVFERGTVQFGRGFTALPSNRYTSASALLGVTTPTEALAFDAADIPYRIGVAQWVFGLLGMLTVWRAGAQRRTTLFFTLTALVTFGLMVPQADAIWRAVKVLDYLQFSYRLLGVLVPCLAWLAGAAVAWVAARRAAASSAAGMAVAGLSLLAAVPFLSPLPW
ncbi:MAG: 6-pyruvoyl-tetrahydropterin synthase-related protein, partial [Anaerolineales bacterium]